MSTLPSNLQDQRFTGQKNGQFERDRQGFQCLPSAGLIKESFDMSLVSLFSHQVGGHRRNENKKSLDILKYGNTILKPLQGDGRGQRAIHFYETTERTNSKFLEFVPKYYGCADLIIDNNKLYSPSSADGPVPLLNQPISHTYMQLEDVITRFKRPCVIDIKMGKQTFSPIAPESKKAKEQTSYPHQKTLGYRIVAMKVYQGNLHVVQNSSGTKSDSGGGYSIYPKQYGKALSPDLINLGLKSFFDCDHSLATQQSLLEQIILRLEDLYSFLSEQTEFRFYASSILIAYEGSVTDSKKCPQLSVHIIDFGHAFPIEDGSPDENYLFGLRNLLSELRSIDLFSSKHTSSIEDKHQSLKEEFVTFAGLNHE